MYLASSAHIKQLDNIAVTKYNIPVSTLMENAGKSIADKILSDHPEKSFVVFCGKGNNGGDGLVVARLLKENGCSVKVWMTDSYENLSEASKIACDKIENIEFAESLNGIEEDAVIIDALLGISLKGEPTGKIKEGIDKINSLKNKKISVDIPSGLSADTGKATGSVVKADYTYTLALDKIGLNVYPGKELCGKKEVLSIGIPDEAFLELKFKNSLADYDMAKSLLIKRKEDGHKGTFGRVGIIGGSLPMSGSVCLAANASLRSGAGMCYVFVPDEIHSVVSTKLTEAIVLKESDISEYLDKLDSIAIGMGYTQNNKIKHIIKLVLKKFEGPVVMDAGAINFVSENKEILKTKRCPIVFTPHPGEFARLTGLNIDEINSNRIFLASKYANELSSVILLKGAATITSSVDGEIRINSSGNSGMATAGSGDVLSGIIAALLSQGMNLYDSASIGAYIHGLSGDIAKEKLTEYGIVAGDIVENIPYAFKQLV